MWPWGHLAVGYLAYSALIRRRTGQPPRATGALALAVGTQFPDLVDKPLAWTLGVLPSGRSFAHSAFVAGVVLLAVWWLARRRGDSTVAFAFGLGYVSHLLADAIRPLWIREYADLAYLAWPLLPVADAHAPGILWYFTTMEWTPFVRLQFALTVLAAVVWVRDGTPGWGPLRRAVIQRIQVGG